MQRNNTVPTEQNELQNKKNWEEKEQKTQNSFPADRQ